MIGKSTKQKYRRNRLRMQIAALHHFYVIGPSEYLVVQDAWYGVGPKHRRFTQHHIAWKFFVQTVSHVNQFGLD